MSIHEGITAARDHITEMKVLPWLSTSLQWSFNLSREDILLEKTLFLGSKYDEYM